MVDVMFSPGPLKADFGEHFLSPSSNIFSPKTFSLTSPLAANLFEEFAVKDGNLCFDALDALGATPARKRKHDCISACEFSNLGDSIQTLSKLPRKASDDPRPPFLASAERLEQIQAVEAEISNLQKVLSELETSVEEAERQNVVVNEENRDLWATLSYLQRCLRLGLQTRVYARTPLTAPNPRPPRVLSHPRRRVASGSGATGRRSRLAEPSYRHTSAIGPGEEPIQLCGVTTPTGAKPSLPPLLLSDPEVANLASVVMSPGTEELFAAACNMFLSPGKPLGNLTPVGKGANGIGQVQPSPTLFSGLLPSPLIGTGLAPSPLPSVAGHKKLFAEELDMVATGHLALACAPCLPELDDEIFAGLDF